MPIPQIPKWKNFQNPIPPANTYLTSMHSPLSCACQWRQPGLVDSKLPIFVFPTELVYSADVLLISSNADFWQECESSSSFIIQLERQPVAMRRMLGGGRYISIIPIPWIPKWKNFPNKWEISKIPIPRIPKWKKISKITIPLNTYLTSMYPTPFACASGGSLAL